MAPRSVLALVLVAAVAVAQPPPEPVAPPPPMALPGEAVVPRELVPPPPPVVPTHAFETLTVPQLVIGAEVGTTFAGWGVWRRGTLVPSVPFAARPLLFPVPVADTGPAVPGNLSITGRATAAYTFSQLPITLTGYWEGYHRRAETLLIGYDPQTAQLLGALNGYNRRQRQGIAQNSDDDSGYTISDPAADPEKHPQLQMRSVPSDQHRLVSRVSANIGGASFAYKVWTPREEQGVEYRLIAGGRYGGFFAEDRAVGDRYLQSAGNWFSGFGPEAGVRFDRRLPLTGGTIWADVRGGALFGEARQKFREFDGIWGGDQPYREHVQRENRTVPFLSTELGVGGERMGVRLAVGVRYSYYWGIGDVGPSRLDFGAVAGFLRLEWGF